MEISFLDEGPVLVFRASAPKLVLTYYRNIELVHARMRALGAARLLIDGSAIENDLDPDQLADVIEGTGKAPQPGMRIAAVLDEALTSLRLLFSLIFNRGHSVAVFNRYAEAISWICGEAEPRREAGPEARGGARVW